MLGRSKSSKSNKSIFTTQGWNARIASIDESKVTTSVPLLVLGCTAYRMQRGAPEAANCYTLTDHVLLSKVTPVDFAMAADIRTHYEQKLLLAMLRTTELTPFRQDLAKFLSSDWPVTSQSPSQQSPSQQSPKGNFCTPHSYLGMAYKLPYFYAYDYTLAREVFNGEYSTVNGPDTVTEPKKLTFLQKINNDTSLSKHHTGGLEYWFADEHNNRVLLEVRPNNPLLPLFDREITESIAALNTITVSGVFFKSNSRDAMQFYKTKDIQLMV